MRNVAILVKYKKESQTLRSTFTANYRSFETETTRILGEEKNIIWNCDNYKANGMWNSSFHLKCIIVLTEMYCIARFVHTNH